MNQLIDKYIPWSKHLDRCRICRRALKGNPAHRSRKCCKQGKVLWMALYKEVKKELHVLLV